MEISPNCGGYPEPWGEKTMVISFKQAIGPKKYPW
jgi:hypothetical protein